MHSGQQPRLIDDVSASATVESGKVRDETRLAAIRDNYAKLQVGRSNDDRLGALDRYIARQAKLKALESHENALEPASLRAIDATKRQARWRVGACAASAMRSSHAQLADLKHAYRDAKGETSPSTSRQQDTGRASPAPQTTSVLHTTAQRGVNDGAVTRRIESAPVIGGGGGGLMGALVLAPQAVGAGDGDDLRGRRQQQGGSRSPSPGVSSASPRARSPAVGRAASWIAGSSPHTSSAPVLSPPRPSPTFGGATSVCRLVRL